MTRLGMHSMLLCVLCLRACFVSVCRCFLLPQARSCLPVHLTTVLGVPPSCMMPGFLCWMCARRRCLRPCVCYPCVKVMQDLVLIQHTGADSSKSKSSLASRLSKRCSWSHSLHCTSLVFSAAAIVVVVVLGLFPRYDERLASLEARSAVETEISAYFNNLDLRRWNDALLFFAPTYYSDYDIDGGFPERVNRSQNWLAWPCFLEGFNTTLHQIGNVVVTLGQSVDADIVLKGTATHNYNGELWTTGGIYHMSMRKANSRYELTRIRYRQHWHEGDETRLMLLALNAAWSKNEEFCLAHGGTKPQPPLA